MIRQSLNGLWQMKKVGSKAIYDAKIPTTMYQVLYENDVIADPFVGENDRVLTELSDDDYSFSHTFDVGSTLLDNDVVELVFYGLDTLATVWLNDKKILTTNNMHRTYKIDVKNSLNLTGNHVFIKFDSPSKYIKKKQAEKPLWGVNNPMDGYEYLRKAHHMFGWDWGPQLPDMGIWRDVELRAYSFACIEDAYITQKHVNDQVELDVKIDCRLFSDDHLELNLVLKDDQGFKVAKKESSVLEVNELTILVESPKLWWPNGYGEQPLYELIMEVRRKGEVVASLVKRIGLRTMTMTREGDQWGESFDMTINGVRIFAMGADYIPEDALICRMNGERTRILLEDCKRANFNHIRVWGGAFYPSDDFYDLCDELGLLVWQDFMFACGVYQLTKQFEATIVAEIEDNVKRIRHHASLGLWCGNNEMEMAFVSWGLPNDENLRLDYLRMYERLIPDILESLDPNTFYWPASPSSGGGFDNPNADDKGDVHYWEVFHGNKHYKTFRQHYFRFASEYGMQAFPDMKTIKGYSRPEEREIYAPVMENHNKCLGDINGNMKIMMNMATEFNLPNTLDEIVYLSQVFQGETIRCAVEHMRRNRGRCMGSTYWQLNDNWPVASWASIDVHGRWKALHYMVKRFYAPIHVTAYELGHEGFIHVCNEQLDHFKGELKWQIRHSDKGIVAEDTMSIDVSELSSAHVVTASIEDYCNTYGDERYYYLSYQLTDENDKLICSDIMLFVNHKYFKFKEATLMAKVLRNEENIEIHVRSDVMAKSVGIEFASVDLLLSDNYFDLIPGETRVIVVEAIRSDVVVGGSGVILDPGVLQEDLRLKAVNTLTYI